MNSSRSADARYVVPYRAKFVEAIALLPREERVKRIESLGLNVFRLPAEAVYIDLLTDSGTGAMSVEQLARTMVGDSAYAGSRSFFRLAEQVEETMGFPHTIPVHQGRAAERVLNTVLIRPGTVVPGNTHFDTTKAHIELAGGRAIDCTIDEGKRSEGEHPFKGNVDCRRLEGVIVQYGARQIAYILLTVTCNSGGGQPVSMANIREVRRIATRHGVKLIIDAARFAENAYFIQQREAGYREKTVADIVREMFACADGCTMSAKKDALVPIGGFLGIRDQGLYEALKVPTILYEGFYTYGGMSGSDMEALAQGLREVVGDAYLAYRIGQVRRFGALLQSMGIPVVEPIGGHAVFIDARKFFPRVPEDQFPAQLLCVEIYKEGGVRSVEVGSCLAGRDPDTGENVRPAMDLCRLTIPRRVYGAEHLDYVADVVRTIYQEMSQEVRRGLRFEQESAGIRHFGSSFAYAESEWQPRHAASAPATTLETQPARCG